MKDKHLEELQLGLDNRALSEEIRVVMDKLSSYQTLMKLCLDVLHTLRINPNPKTIDKMIQEIKKATYENEL